MKGPYERRKYDLDRVWECPVCHHRQRTSGAVTSCLCTCQLQRDPSQRQVMQLVSDGPRRTEGSELKPKGAYTPRVMRLFSEDMDEQSIDGANRGDE